MTLKTIVIDDEPLALGLIESYVSKTPFLEHIASFSSAVEALHSQKLEHVDLLFLDIQMPTLNGLELSKTISPKTRIVFTTAFDMYAIDSYKVNALDYLLKPISYSDFLGAANKALSWFELVTQTDKATTEETVVSSPAEHNIECIYVKSDYKLMRIDLAKLLYVEGLKDYVKFYIEDQPKPIMSLMSLKKTQELLPTKQFIRVNKSYIVNKDSIKIIERNRIIIEDTHIPIGDAYKGELQDYLKIRSL